MVFNLLVEKNLEVKYKWFTIVYSFLHFKCMEVLTEQGKSIRAVVQKPSYPNMDQILTHLWLALVAYLLVNVPCTLFILQVSAKYLVILAGPCGFYFKLTKLSIKADPCSYGQFASLSSMLKDTKCCADVIHVVH